MPKAFPIPKKGIKSDPPKNKKKIKNIWWDPDTEELCFDVED